MAEISHSVVKQGRRQISWHSCKCCKMDRRHDLPMENEVSSELSIYRCESWTNCLINSGVTPPPAQKKWANHPVLWVAPFVPRAERFWMAMLKFSFQTDALLLKIPPKTNLQCFFPKFHTKYCSTICPPKPTLFSILFTNLWWCIFSHCTELLVNIWLLEHSRWFLKSFSLVLWKKLD